MEVTCLHSYCQQVARDQYRPEPTHHISDAFAVSWRPRNIELQRKRLKSRSHRYVWLKNKKSIHISLVEIEWWIMYCTKNALASSFCWLNNSIQCIHQISNRCDSIGQRGFLNQANKSDSTSDWPLAAQPMYITHRACRALITQLLWHFSERTKKDVFLLSCLIAKFMLLKRAEGRFSHTQLIRHKIREQCALLLNENVNC